MKRTTLRRVLWAVFVLFICGAVFGGIRATQSALMAVLPNIPQERAQQDFEIWGVIAIICIIAAFANLILLRCKKTPNRGSV